MIAQPMKQHKSSRSRQISHEGRAQALGDKPQAMQRRGQALAAHRNLGVLYAQAAQAEKTAQYIAWTDGLGFAPAAFYAGLPEPDGGYLAAAADHLEQARQLAPGDAVAGYMVEQPHLQ